MRQLHEPEGRVLLVEDEPKLLESYAGHFASVGFEVAKAHDAAEAIQILGSRSFDVVLTDVDLADESGLTVARRARELQTDDVAVILLSMKNLSDNVRRIIADSGFSCMTKPVEPHTLSKATIRLLQQRDGRIFDNRNGDEVVLASFTATDVKNRFSDVLEAALRDGAAVIQKHSSTKAVLLSWDEYVALTAARRTQLQDLTAKFDTLLARMQTPEFTRAAQSAFDASPEELGAAAVKAARSRK